MDPENLLDPMDAFRSALKEASRARKKIAFLVGSPLSMQVDPNAPQVPGVTAILQLVEEKLPIEYVGQFKAELKAGKSNAYQWAMSFLQARSRQGIADEVILDAVLRARKDRHQDVGRSLAEIDNDFRGWALPPATEHLGRLVIEHPDRFGPLLTTNFDPLLSASIRAAGGEVFQKIVVRNESFSQGKVSAAGVTPIIHLHGYWLDDGTLHTPQEISSPRPAVIADLAQLLRTHTLAVVGYGGWDDVFTQTLKVINADPHQDIDILWAFFEQERPLVDMRYSHLFSHLTELTRKTQIRRYGGINCHEVFAKLREDFNTIGISTVRSVTATWPPTELASPPTTAPPPCPPTTPVPTNAAAVPAPVKSGQAEPSLPTKHRSRPLLAAAIAVPLLLAAAALLVTPEKTRPTPQVITLPPPNGLAITPRPFSPPGMEAVSSLAELRQLHMVTSTSGADRVSRVAQLPKGRYGFVRMEAVPALSAATPIQTNIRDGVEVHRTPANSLFLVGYIKPSSSTPLASGRATSIVLSPTYGGGRTQAVSILFGRIASAEVHRDGDTSVLVLNLNGAH